MLLLSCSPTTFSMEEALKPEASFSPVPTTSMVGWRGLVRYLIVPRLIGPGLCFSPLGGTGDRRRYDWGLPNYPSARINQNTHYTGGYWRLSSRMGKPTLQLKTTTFTTQLWKFSVSAPFFFPAPPPQIIPPVDLGGARPGGGCEAL